MLESCTKLTPILVSRFSLDLESIDALVEAIKDFKGGLMVVSHDQFFVTNTCSELWVVANGKATRFRGDFEEYKKHTLERTRKRVEASVKMLSTINN
jgi:ABC-type dipeptide/oligopeptide/nickel transport system ATPase subunit